MSRTLLAFTALLLSALHSASVHAHPLGNNTVNRQAAIEVSRGTLAIRYLADLAEIPTLLAASDADANGDGTTSPEEWRSYARVYGERVRDGLDVRVDGHPLALSLRPTRSELVAGAAGLNTLRIDVRLSAPLDARGQMKIEYRDHRRVDEPGWKEVFIRTGDGVRVNTSDVPGASLSRDLTTYPSPGSEMANVVAATFEAASIAADSSAVYSAKAGARESSKPRAAAHQTAEEPDARIAAAVQLPPSPPISQPGGPALATSSLHLPAWSFFRLGVHHIATGWDHLVFLLGLLVAQRSLRRLAGVVTAFTAAHSLTLGLAASGLVTLPGAWVEPAIALTIAYVGLSNLLGRSRHTAALAFAFGLVHGFGFAGALAESLGNTPIGGGGWLLDLAAFNLGIETFQLGLILLVLPLLWLAMRRSWSGTLHNVASLVVMGAGLGWFVSRIY